MLVPVRLGLRRGTMHQHTQTAAGDLPDSCVSLPLHSMPLRSRARPRCIARTLAAPASFRSTSRLLGDRQGGCSLCLPASRIDFMQSGMFRDRADRGTCRWHLRSSGWHERNDQVLRCSFLRACELGLASFLSHKSHYVHSRPSTGTRSRRTPGAGSPPSPAYTHQSIRRPDGVTHNSALWPKKSAQPVTLTALPALASGGAVRAPVSPASFTPSRRTFAA